MLVLTIMSGEAFHNVSSLDATPPGEFSALGTPIPVTDDYGLVFSAPVQIPILVPNQPLNSVSPVKYRTSLRTNIHRRYTNRQSANIYTPIAASGRMTVERMSAPLRHTRAIHFYVLELCRLLC